MEIIFLVIKMNAKNINLIIFMICSNMVLYSQISFSTFINNLENYAHYGLLCYLVPIIIVCFLYKGFKKGFNPIINIEKNIVIKFISIVYLSVFSIIILYLTSTVIKVQFYSELPILIIFIGLITTCIYLSLNSPNQIINISSIFFIIILLFNLVPFFHIQERNFNLLLPIGINKNIYKCFIIFLFPLDNIIFSINSASYDKGFSRKTFLIGNLCSFSLLLIIFLDNLTLLSYKYYVGTIFSPFIRWSVYQGNKFIESYEILLLIIIIITTIFRVAYNLSTTRILLKYKKNIKSSAVIFTILLIILTILYMFINMLNSILTISLIILLILIMILFTYFIILSYKSNKQGSEHNG